MDFKQLLELLGENSEAVTFVKSLETNATKNVETINNLERAVGEIKTTRDKFKTGNTLVKSLLGIETVNEDSISEALNKLKGNKGDDASIAEIANLKDLLEKATSDNDLTVAEYESKLSTMALDNEISNSGVGANVANEAMFGIVKGLIKDGASYENGKIVYKNKDGSTMYASNNQPMTIADKMNVLKSDANYSGLFKADDKGGSGTPPAGANSISGQQSMSGTEMMKQGRK